MITLPIVDAAEMRVFDGRTHSLRESRAGTEMPA